MNRAVYALRCMAALVAEPRVSFAQGVNRDHCPGGRESLVRLYPPGRRPSSMPPWARDSNRRSLVAGGLVIEVAEGSLRPDCQLHGAPGLIGRYFLWTR